MGLSTALRAADYTDEAPTYWTPDEGVTIQDFELIENGSFSQSVIDAIQDDSNEEEETHPEGAWYAATLNTSGTTSVTFFDENRQIITA